MRARAIIIGVDRYDRLRALACCSKDGAAVAKALRSKYRQLTIDHIGTTGAANGDTTAETLAKALEVMGSAQLAQSDVALLYFAGHGFSAAGRDYLAMKDANITDERRTGIIAIEDVIASLVSSGAGTAVLMLDACRNNLDRRVDDFGKSTAELARRHGVVVFFGCSPGEVCQELPELEHGVFTECLLKTINETGVVGTPFVIDRLVTERVQRRCAEYNLASQRPYTVVAPIQKAAFDLFTGQVRPPGELRTRSWLIVAGASNSGKTTVGTYLAREHGYLHVEMSTYAWQRYSKHADKTMSIQDFMENVVWDGNSNLDAIAADLLATVQDVDRLVICGPRTVEEVEAIQAAIGSAVQVAFLHTSTNIRIDRYHGALDKRNRWDASHADIIHRDYRELSWGLAKMPLLPGTKLLINEGDVTDICKRVARLLPRQSGT